MEQEQRLNYLISELIAEQERYSQIEIPVDISEKKRLFRALVNVRPAKRISDDFLKVQDQYLKQEIIDKGITDEDELEFLNDRMCLWQGDITTLKCGAIVNAANSGMTGCYYPCHGCIDNAIHTYSGIQLRLECADIMDKQGFAEPTGRAKITKAYNLPCEHIIHTVGPVVGNRLTQNDCEMLSSCYRSCLEIAEENGVRSIAFCCISTGEFHFPNQKAAQIAVSTVSEYLKDSDIKRVIFNVFKDEDYVIYKRLLTSNEKNSGIDP